MALNRPHLWFGAFLRLVALVATFPMPLGPWASVQASTVGLPQTFVCPVCRHAFEPSLAGSGTQMGMRLDFRPLGPIASPWPIPDCPRCHNVWFPPTSPRPPAGELPIVTKTVRSPAYTRLVAAPSYHRLAFLHEALKKPARDVAMLWLAAGWQWEGTTNRVQERACRDRCASWIDRHLDSRAAKSGAPDFEAVLLRADLMRRAGEFEKAIAWLNRWASQPAFRGGLAPRIIARQRLLIAARITTPEPLEESTTPRPGHAPKPRTLKLTVPNHP